MPNGVTQSTYSTPSTGSAMASFNILKAIGKLGGRESLFEITKQQVGEKRGLLQFADDMIDAGEAGIDFMTDLAKSQDIGRLIGTVAGGVLGLTFGPMGAAVGAGLGSKGGQDIARRLKGVGGVTKEAKRLEAPEGLFYGGERMKSQRQLENLIKGLSSKVGESRRAGNLSAVIDAFNAYGLAKLSPTIKSASEAAKAGDITFKEAFKDAGGWESILGDIGINLPEEETFKMPDELSWQQGDKRGIRDIVSDVFTKEPGAHGRKAGMDLGSQWRDSMFGRGMMEAGEEGLQAIGRGVGQAGQGIENLLGYIGDLPSNMPTGQSWTDDWGDYFDSLLQK